MLVPARLNRLVKNDSSGKSRDRMLDEWSIGIYAGPSPFDLKPLRGAENPVLTWRQVSDIPARFVADPFMIKADGRWYMFFEAMNRESQKGEIGVAVSEDGLNWRYEQIVLAEPFHLSYPYVFEWMGDHYMVPETHQAGGVRLYRAVDFPLCWSFAGTLVAGLYFADPSLFWHENRWWLLVDASPERRHDTLRLFWADSLSGRWTEHPQSPIVSGDPRRARPAGRVVAFNGRWVRYAQDCRFSYGSQVHAFEIVELTPTSYRERESPHNPVVCAGSAGWNEAGMHHVDPHPLEDGRWIACVDGLCWKEHAR